MIPLTHVLIFTSILFGIGLFGAVTRRHVVGILISVELMINAVNVNLVAFSRYTNANAETGTMFTIFTIVLAAAAAAVGLAIVVSIYRNEKSVYSDEIDLLKW